MKLNETDPGRYRPRGTTFLVRAWAPGQCHCIHGSRQFDLGASGCGNLQLAALRGPPSRCHRSTGTREGGQMSRSALVELSRWEWGLTAAPEARIRPDRPLMRTTSE